MTEKQAIFLRGVYKKLFHPLPEPPAPPCLKDKEQIQRIVYDKLIEGRPLMVARFGSIELTSLDNALMMKEHRSNWGYVSWRTEPNYFTERQVVALCNNAGFFPMPDKEMMFRFLELMRKDMEEVDVLGSWRYNERLFDKELEKAIKVDRELMTPLLTEHPWTMALKGKKVLVVHPFVETIEKQYEKREELFSNADILPPFELMTLKAVQSQAHEKVQFADWFEALQYQKDQIDTYDYDVCLLGCGAYGFPLAAHCKRQGKQAIHLGGVLQLLFGITGKRWETEEVYQTTYPYLKTYQNEYWVRPSKTEMPKGGETVEGGCYW